MLCFPYFLTKFTIFNSVSSLLIYSDDIGLYPQISNLLRWKTITFPNLNQRHMYYVYSNFDNFIRYIFVAYGI
jgi:hypothetical protein